jgi:hypothetical protein
MQQPSGFRRWEIALAVLLGGGALLWALPTLWSGRGLDFGMAYRGGQAAWASGHPEAVHTWMSTSFLALMMALVSQLLPLPIAVRVHTALNLALAATVIVVVWRELRGQLPRTAWWLTLAAAVFFAPLVSTVGYKQFNLLALGLALGGFALVRRDRMATGGALIAASICLKPVAALLVPALLLRRDTRAAGGHAVAWIAALTLASQCFLALRAGDVGLLAPQHAISDYAQRSSPWILQSGNYAPLGLLCRLAGLEAASRGWVFERAVVGLFVVLLALLAADALRDQPGRSWDVFAYACLLSPMISPVAWTHYQLLLAPLFLLLACRFTLENARWPFWVLLGCAYLLAELVVEPWGTLPGGIRFLLTGESETAIDRARIDDVAQFAQYVLFVAAWAWFSRRRETTS